MFLNCDFLQLFHDSVENGSAELGSGNFPAPEEEADLNLVALFEELHGPVQFHLKVMITDLQTEPHLLYLNLLLILLVFSKLLRLLVAIFTPIEDLYHGWLGSGSYLCQIKTRFSGCIEGLPEAHYATLRTVDIDQTHCLGGNLTIQADFVYLEVSLKSSRVL